VQPSEAQSPARHGARECELLLPATDDGLNDILVQAFLFPVNSNGPCSVLPAVVLQGLPHNYLEVWVRQDFTSALETEDPRSEPDQGYVPYVLTLCIYEIVSHVNSFSDEASYGIDQGSRILNST
jgi:hypothetical protein